MYWSSKDNESPPRCHVAMAQNIRCTLCCSMQLCPVLSVQQCQAGPSPRQEIEPMYSVLYPYIVHVQSKKSDYNNGTRLPSSRRLRFSSDRNITKRPCHPVWSCCWHVGTRTVLPNLHDAIFACHLNGQFCFTNLALEDAFNIVFHKTTKMLQQEVFTQQYSLTDYECDPIEMMKEISLQIFLFFAF